MLKRQCCRLLVEARASKGAQNAKGQTPWEAALAERRGVITLTPR